ncbi:type IV secretion system protein [Defluviicoccus vanus]|nr:type IV secretion system protein [Defluviicoccus vanus]
MKILAYILATLAVGAVALTIVVNVYSHTPDNTKARELQQKISQPREKLSMTSNVAIKIHSKRTDHMDTFSQFGDAFGVVIANGFDRLMPIARYLAISMMTIALMLVCAGLILRRSNIMNAGFMFAITGGFYILVIESVMPIGEGIMESAVRYGLIAGGSGMNAATFLRSPDTLFTIGYAKATDLFEVAALACDNSSIGCLGAIDTWLPTHAAAWVVFLTFALVGVVMLATAILFKLALLAGVLLLPLAVFPPTSSFGFMPIRAVIHFAVQLMVLTLVTSVAVLVFSKLTVGAHPGFSSARPFLLASLVFVGMVLGSSRLAYSLTSGAMLQAGALFGAPAGIAVMAGRSVAGHLDGPATAATSKGWQALKAAGARLPGAARSAGRTLGAVGRRANP